MKTKEELQQEIKDEKDWATSIILQEIEDNIKNRMQNCEAYCLVDTAKLEHWNAEYGLKLSIPKVFDDVVSKLKESNYDVMKVEWKKRRKSYTCILIWISDNLTQDNKENILKNEIRPNR